MHPPLFGPLLLAVLLICQALHAELEFEPKTIDGEVAIGYGLAIGDVDGDGKDDILLADKRTFSWFRNPEWDESIMASNLTLRDNVCIAAADINDDGQVEVAVGAQWNPGETNDYDQSGAVFFLDRPEDPTKEWTPVKLPHEPTTHRMRWVKNGYGRDYALAVLPLHGIGNVKGEGENLVNLTAYVPDLDDLADPEKWEHWVRGRSMHLTHNFDTQGGEYLVAGAEGIMFHPIEDADRNDGLHISPENSTPPTRGAGEVRWSPDYSFIAAIEPLHGNDLVVYRGSIQEGWERELLTDQLAQGHALAIGDMNGDGREDIVYGWREKDAEGHVGTGVYLQTEDGGWESSWKSLDLVAVEDLKLADLDGDEKLDIVAAGRATNNLVIFWNRSE